MTLPGQSSNHATIYYKKDFTLLHNPMKSVTVYVHILETGDFDYNYQTFCYNSAGYGNGPTIAHECTLVCSKWI